MKDNENPPENPANNVTPIAEARKKKDEKKAPKPKADKDDKMSLGEFLHEMAIIIDGDKGLCAKDAFGSSDPLPKFERKFRVIIRKNGARDIIEIQTNNICRYVKDNVVTDAVVQYVDKHMFRFSQARRTLTEFGQVVGYWRAVTEPLEKEPDAIAFKSEDKLCFHRLSFDLGDGPKETPCLDDIKRRCPEWRALFAFMASLFDFERCNQQFLYLVGDGGGGKGSLMRGMQAALGDSFVSLVPPRGDGPKRWFAAKMLGKRLGVFNDTNHRSLFRSEALKSITGNDQQEIEFKGKDSFNARLNVYICAVSNFKPELPDDRAMRRRLILVEIDNYEGDLDPSYEAKLAAEIPSMVTEGMQLWREKYNRTRIDHEESLDTIMADVSEAAEAHLSTFFEKYFELVPDTNASIRQSVPITQIKRLLQENRMLDRLQDFTRYARREVGLYNNRPPAKCTEGLCRIDGTVTRVVYGIRLRPGVHPWM